MNKCKPFTVLRVPTRTRNRQLPYLVLTNMRVMNSLIHRYITNVITQRQTGVAWYCKPRYPKM